MLQVTTVPIFMTSVRPPRGLATIMGKEIDWGDANIGTIEEDASQKVMGTIPGTGRGFCSSKTLLMCTIMSI